MLYNNVSQMGVFPQVPFSMSNVQGSWYEEISSMTPLDDNFEINFGMTWSGRGDVFCGLISQADTSNSNRILEFTFRNVFTRIRTRYNISILDLTVATYPQGFPITIVFTKSTNNIYMMLWTGQRYSFNVPPQTPQLYFFMRRNSQTATYNYNFS
jgi:hypothetical protein